MVGGSFRGHRSPILTTAGNVHWEWLCPASTTASALQNGSRSGMPCSSRRRQRQRAAGSGGGSGAAAGSVLQPAGGSALLCWRRAVL